MTGRRGTFIVIEGTDGSGKGTQFALLRERLQQAGYQVAAFDFPQYGQPSGYFVQQYLDGAYGSADEVGPYTASLFYALDRYEAASKINAALEQGKIVISNRFTGSNMGHQGTKFNNPEQRRGYFIWLDNLEFEMLKIPRPDVSFVLRVPAETAQQLRNEREQKDKMRKRDIHEADLRHMQQSVLVYDDLCQLFPKDFQRIDCVRGDKLLDVETIQSLLWEKIVPLLPQPPQLEMPMPASKLPDIAQDTESKDAPANETAEPDPTPKQYVTDPTKKVYGFTGELSPKLSGAVLALLAHGGGALSPTILEQFVEAALEDEQIAVMAINGYSGSDVTRLAGQHLVAADISQLAAAELQSNRSAAFVEVPARWIRYEQKNQSGTYKYHVPDTLRPEVAAQYRAHIDEIFEIYGSLLPKLAAHLKPQKGETAALAARTILAAVLPVAATKTVGVYASAQTIQQMIVQSQASDLAELKDIGANMLEVSRQLLGPFMRDAGRPENSGANTLYRTTTRAAMQAIINKKLHASHSTELAPVRLTAVSPRNELDIVTDMLYEHSNLSYVELAASVDTWPYAKRLAVFEAYMGERANRYVEPGKALEKIQYTWELITSFSTFRDLQRHRASHPARQTLTPRYGYELPQVIDDAELGDDFERCFDISLKLHSLLQQEGYEQEAAYATLNGHRVRWTATFSGCEAFAIHEQHTTSQTSPDTRVVVQQMYAALAETHPLIAETMHFADTT